MSLVPQIGMSELFLLAMLALIVIGPKDLPKLMRTVGQMMAHIRRLSDEFRNSFDQMARETEIEEMRNEIEALKKANPATEVQSALADGESALMTDPSAIPDPAVKS